MRSFAILIFSTLMFFSAAAASMDKVTCAADPHVEFNLAAGDISHTALRNYEETVRALEGQEAEAEVALAAANGADAEREALVALTSAQVQLPIARDQLALARRLFEKRAQNIIDRCGDAGRELLRERYGF